MYANAAQPMEVIFFFIILAFAGALIRVFTSYMSKLNFLSTRKNKEKIIGTVLEYRSEKKYRSMRKDHTMTNFPYVRIESEGPDQGKIIKVHYPSQIFLPFKIGESIDVFWYAGVLYFWHAYARGLARFLPSRQDL